MKTNGNDYIIPITETSIPNGEQVNRLTKREYFSTLDNIYEEEVGPEFCKAVTGLAMPDDIIERYKWFASGEAALRVIKADALINELNKTT